MRVKAGKGQPAGLLSFPHLQMPSLRGPRPEGLGVAGRDKVKRYLLVSFQLLHEGTLVEEPLQPVLGVVVAQLLKGGPTGRPTLLGVLEARSVHNHHRAERVLAGLESPSQREAGSELARAIPPNRPHWSAPRVQAAPSCPSQASTPVREPRTLVGRRCLSWPKGQRALWWWRMALLQQSHKHKGIINSTSVKAETREFLGPLARHSPIHQRDEKGEQLAVEARCHAL